VTPRQIPFPSAAAVSTLTAALFLAGCSPALPHLSAQSSSPYKGEGCTTAVVIDRDCDGYGVGSPLGPDADDQDPAVNTAASALKKYGTLDKVLAHLGYTPALKYFIATNGNDETGEADNPEKPYATFGKVRTLVAPGDAILWRGGTYYEGKIELLNVRNKGGGGLPGKPLILMAYPGEKVVLDQSKPSDGFYAVYLSHWILDGVIIHATGNKGGRALTAGGKTTDTIIRNVEISGFYSGPLIMDGVDKLLIEHSSFHDIVSTHCLYLGSRQSPNSDITIRGNLLYHSGAAGHGLQHNGRVTNLVVEGNIIHGNPNSCMSFLQGVSHSLIQNNVCFGNNHSAIGFFNEPSPEKTIQQYDQNYNVVRNNTFVVNGSDHTQPVLMVRQDTPGAPRKDLGHNTYQGNVFYVATGAPAFIYDSIENLKTDTFKDNVIYTSGSAAIVEGVKRDWKWVRDTVPGFTRNLTVDPGFVAIDAAPDRLDLRLRPGSPAIGLAEAAGSAPKDITGHSRGAAPDAGAYQHGAKPPGPR
jgi:hypothetical protein